MADDATSRGFKRSPAPPGNHGKTNSEIARLSEHLSRLAATDSADWERQGELYGRLGDLLILTGRIPEATQAYQLATDSFFKLEEDHPRSKYFAGKVVSCVNELRKRPSERLDLLLVKLENQVSGMIASDSAPLDVAQVVLRLATILHRRDRFLEAEPKYLQAISHLVDVEGAELQLADVHQRLAGLYQYELSAPARAIVHYDRAIALYEQFEEAFEGEQMNRNLCEELLAGARAAALSGGMTDSTGSRE